MSIEMIKSAHLIVWDGEEFLFWINGNRAKFVGRALRDSALQKKSQ